MRYLLTLFAVVVFTFPAFAGQITLNFADLGTDPARPISLGNFYNGGAGGDYGITGEGGFRDPFEVGGSLTFPLHGPGTLFVSGGFTGTFSFFYNGFLADPTYRHGLTLTDSSGDVVASTLMPQTPSGQYEPFSLSFSGVATEIHFGMTADKNWLGNAGDMRYSSMTFSDLVGINDPGPVTGAPEPKPIVMLLFAAALAVLGLWKRRLPNRTYHPHSNSTV